MFGLTHPGGRDSDTICVFQGAKTPHILRPQDDGTWEFVGEAYVHGLMYGEAEKIIDGRLLETRTFVLL